ncbi:MAG TPA: hypothetical protein ACN46L_06140 [Prochlorococcus sp.]
MGGFTPTTSFTPFSQRGSRLNRERLWRDPLARPSFPESLTTQLSWSFLDIPVGATGFEPAT